MFDQSRPGPDALRTLDDAALVSAIQGWARETATADACRLAAIAELVARRCVDEHPDWACDDWDACAAEVACALTLGHGRASGQMDLAVTLRDRLPKIGALFLAGELPTRTVETIARRTYRVTDADALAALDTDIAESAVRWGPLSQYKLEQAVDAAVERHDPGALHRTRDRSRGRDFTVGDPNDDSGTTSVWGRLSSPDAALVQQRLNAMIRGVCDDDPRTLAQRRADAIGAMAAHASVLTCQCGNLRCPAGAVDDGRASSIIVHIVAEQSALTARPDPFMHGDGSSTEPTSQPEPELPAPRPRPAPEPPRPPTRTADLRLAPAPDPEPLPEPDPAPESPAAPRRTAGLIPGMPTGLVPAPLLAELIARGAKVRFVGTPDTQPEKCYRPSAALDEFVRTRDLTCRFPGCDRPAVYADIDHTTAWPIGPTHPSNTKCYCRKHHLVKTFWPGWTDRQMPDGTVVITTPSGHTYTTKPAGALLFPCWDTTTPSLPPPPTAPPPTPSFGRTLMMPRRKQTRAKARAYRINAERARNDAEVAERNAPKPF